ncbi:MAG: NAD(P)/FAD-dependent oxidoreductase [Oscillospiraceae bacterium]|jgi:2,4-dienoyl-CoA reductase-like NADH-dependent reductase (Old Yellow Enzyme family)/thioredoxin reductase|nr:NAD(P)/FAD-dependent oxidoreductase [Oscillospiraceae bacterium]
MSRNYPHAYAPIQIRGAYYKNRLELSPPGAGGTGDEKTGFVTPALLDYFRPFARGGAAVVTVGNCSIDTKECFDEPGQIDLSSDDCIPALATFARMCDTYGTIGQLEINHCGATQGNLVELPDGNGWAPSPVITPAERVRARMANREPRPTREMSIAKVEETIQKFADAAGRCKKAGYKSVMFHGAHGNLLAQFLSPVFNLRTDKYGGSLHNKARFAVEMLDAVRAAIGEDVVIEYRISSDEMAEGHTRFPETLEFIGLIKDKVDILHVSAGLHDTQGEPWVMRPMIPPYTYPQNYNRERARIIKSTYPDLLINVVGANKSPAQADEIIASGDADFVSFMRALLGDPFMPQKYATGCEYQHAPCIRCQCLQFSDGGFSGPCTVNPIVNYSREYPDGRVPKASVAKRAAVIGGGPAGITAAKTLIERGHSVTLYEKSAALGGQIQKAAAPRMKQDMREYLAYLQAYPEKAGVLLKLNTQATPELIAAEGYDTLIVAVGAEPARPPIPGAENALWAPDYPADSKDSRDIVILGAGAIGIECAIELAENGKKVTILEMNGAPNLGMDLSALGGGDDLLKKCNELGVEIICDARALGYNNGELRYSKNGAENAISNCELLLATGMNPLTSYARSFQNAAPNTEVFIVGDCLKVGDIRTSTRGAFDLTRGI